jgi:hypothetical protein
MGYEYHLKCQNFDRQAALTFLRRRFVLAGSSQPLLRLALPQPDTDNWRVTTKPDWPSVLLAFEPDGFYFCDNRTSTLESALIFKLLTEFLLSTNDEIRISEL